MRVQRENETVPEFGGAAFDAPHHRVAVLHGKGEVSAHEGAAHALVLFLRNLSHRDQPLAAAADRAVERTHAQLALARLADDTAPQTEDLT